MLVLFWNNPLKKWMIFFIFAWTLSFFCIHVFASERSLLLSIRPVADDFFNNALEGSNPELTDADKMVIVVGIINSPSFSVKNINNIALYDGTNHPIRLIADKSSFYSEFDDDDINSLRIAFIVNEALLDQGSPRLVWGDAIHSENKEVEKIHIYKAEKGIYRTFSLEERPEGYDSRDYFATVDVIVDDYADTYYIWYLLPMALIFSLLFFKKAFLK